MTNLQKSIFTADHLLFDIDVNNIKDAFKQIAEKAKELGVITDVDSLVKELENREKVGTTGLSEQFAIPHASSSDITRPCVIAARFKQPIDWKSVDDKPVQFVICLLIPNEKLSELHVTYLARIANSLLNEWFKNELITAKKPATIVRLIKDALENKAKPVEPTKKDVAEEKQIVKTVEQSQKTDKPKKILVGVTGCATGIAHTFMARTAIEKYGEAHGYEVWIETQGQDGPQHIIPEELIKKADFVIIASDIHIDSDRFFGKRLYKCDTNEAINTPSIAFKNMEQKAVLISAGSGYSNPQAMKKQKNGFMKHFLSGVSHMIPVLVFSGIICSIVTAIVNGLYLDAYNEYIKTLVENIPSFSTWLSLNHEWAYVLMTIANVGFTLFTAVMGAYIAESIAGRAAFAPGLIASFVMGNTGNGWVWWWPGIPQSAHVQVSGQWVDISGISIGVLSAIIMGFAAGYLVKAVLRIKVKDTYKPLMSILFIPVICTSALVFPYVFLLSAVFCCAMNYIGAGIAIAGGVPGVNFLIGFLLGLMVGVDMGGPVNKIAVSTGTGLISIDPRFMGACAAAIPIAPLATGLCCVMFRKIFDEEDFRNGVAAIGLGAMGISEGAIPMFTKYPKQTFVANIIGSAVAGGLAFTFFCGGHVAMYGGPISAACLGIYADPGKLGIVIPTVFGGTGTSAAQNNGMQFISILWFFVAIAGGVAVECVVYYFMIRAFKLYRWKGLARMRKHMIKKAEAECEANWKHMAKLRNKVRKQQTA